MQNVALDSMEAELAIEPIDIRLEYLQRNEIIKIATNELHNSLYDKIMNSSSKKYTPFTHLKTIMKDTIKKIAKERNIHIKETEITKEHNTEQIINDNIKIKRLKEAKVKTHISETKIETKENFENQLQNQ